MAADDRPSLALDLFDRIVNGDSVKILRDMVEGESKATESEWLEFKAYPRGDFVEPMKGCGPKNLKAGKKDSIKETWSEVLSAFANTQGGVVIWGIHAAKNADGVDEASAFEFVPNPKALATRLRELHHEATDPPIPDVRIEPFSDPSEKNENGFVVCYVPESRYSPHRARYRGEQFYYRSIDKSVVIPIPMLRRLFYPQTKLTIEVESHSNCEIVKSEEGLFFRLFVSFAVTNKGRASAKSLVIGIDCEHNDIKTSTLSHVSPWIVTQNPNHRLTLTNESNFHPGFCSQFLYIRNIETDRKKLDRPGPYSSFYVPKFSKIDFYFDLFSENFEPQLHHITLTSSDFENQSASKKTATVCNFRSRD